MKKTFVDAYTALSVEDLSSIEKETINGGGPPPRGLLVFFAEGSLSRVMINIREALKTEHMGEIRNMCDAQLTMYTDSIPDFDNRLKVHTIEQHGNVYKYSGVAYNEEEFKLLCPYMHGIKVPAGKCLASTHIKIHYTQAEADAYEANKGA